jgi:diguanylate cyclase (GGDEF)-like protein
VAAVGVAHRHAEVHTDTAFIVGLTLEFGRIMLLGENPHEVMRISELRCLQGSDRLDLERAVFGQAHHEIFLTRAADWGLPDQLLHAIRDHHNPVDDLPILSRVARWADLCAETYTASDKGESRDRCVRILMVEDGWDKKGAETFLNGLAGSMASAADMLAITIGDQTGLDQLIRLEAGVRNPETMANNELLTYLQEVLEERDHLHKHVQQLQASLQALTHYDQLTGLANRNRHIQTLRQETQRAQRYSQELSLVIVDVDNFTALNARYGQNAGDQVLKRVGTLLGRISRDVDHLARIGGDEFGVILPETNHSGGRVFAERVRAGLEALRVDVGDSRILLSGTVAGVTLANLPRGVDHEGMHAAAMRGSAALRGRGGNRASWGA